MNIHNQLKAITENRLATSNGDYVQYAVTVLIEPKTYQAAIKSGDPLDYLSKNLKRHLKAHGISTSSLWFVLELSNKNNQLQNPHIHGSITIEREQRHQLSDALQKALGKPRVKSAARKRAVREIYSSEWVDYCFKDFKKTSDSIGRRAVFVARELTKFFGKNENSKNAHSPDTARLESNSEKVCLVRYFNPSKNTINPVQKTLTKTYPKTIYDLLRERGCEAPHRRRRK
ncbi:hypothetical protein L1D24_20860 [Vibrio brasiliensis]|uniref:hypothetical protein n=1 Tax=Vibrio brasiliensis TaxID=170652 RepID=UPI001EFC9B4D|nr:hypothetical protein [Vibrio brasiliensis]MCG9650988.1 hypothetical protein [Vibrio brasiliensis]